MAFQSCFTTLAIINSQVNRDIMEKPNYEENIKLVKNNCPELYKMYCSGAIKITDVEKYNKENKVPIIQVNIGWENNKLKQTIKKLEEKSDSLLNVPDYFKDAKKEQWIVYKKK